tara:strand:- start:13396 stop:13773 length:378 start_codon:yes stop_codon:yes gene_type:complete
MFVPSLIYVTIITSVAYNVKLYFVINNIVKTQRGINNTMSNDIFDFGFTLVDENELEAVQQAQSQVNSVSSSVVDVQDKLDKLYNAVQPLLNNLKQNPEKEYILWPKRLEKIEQFEDHIQTIYKG